MVYVAEAVQPVGGEGWYGREVSSDEDQDGDRTAQAALAAEAAETALSPERRWKR